MNDLSIRNKLLLMVLFPLCVMLYFSVSDTLQKQNTAWIMNRLHGLLIPAVKISALVHETQKERRLSSAYLGSGGKNFSAELETQRAATDGENRRPQATAGICRQRRHQR